MALVIIGLLIAGVLVGQDIIKAAQIRSQISQIDKYQIAVNTFKIKTGFLPGDIPEPTASALGFLPRGPLSTSDGQGDGDNMINGFCIPCGGAFGWQVKGEALMFWVDLSTAGLIDGGFNTATFATYPTTDVTGENVLKYFPKAKIGSGIYVRTINANNVPNQYKTTANRSNPKYANSNFFSISKINTIDFSSPWAGTKGTTGIAVNQTYAIDSKIDDGLPLSGKITTVSSLNSDISFSNGDMNLWSNDNHFPSENNISPSATTCYDNKNNSNNPTTYSLSQSSGNGLNCSLSFQFQ